MQRHSYAVIILLLLWSASALHAQKKQNDTISVTDENGNVSTGKMTKGNKNGEWRTVDKRGRLIRTENYSGGQLNGLAIVFFPPRDTLDLNTYRNGILHGLSYHFLRPDKREEGYYVNGKKEGWWVTHWRTSAPTIDSFYYVHNAIHGVYKHYHAGKLITVEHYANGLKHGGDTSFNYDTSAIEMTGYWRYGKRDSIYREYLPTGEVVKQMMYRSDTIMYDSVWNIISAKRVLIIATLYNMNGIKTYSECYRCGVINSHGLTSINYYYGEDGLIDSLYEYYSGVLNYINYYNQDLTSDTERGYNFHQLWFDSKGRMSAQGERNGWSFTGTWTWMDSTGKVIKEIKYEPSNVPVRYTCFYPNGGIKIAGRCEGGTLSDSIHVYSEKGKEIKAGSSKYKQILRDHFITETDIRYYDPEAAEKGQEPE